MRIALVHDSLTQEGGAERVVEALMELFPNAPLFTLVCSLKFKQKYAGRDIRTSPLQTLYLAYPKLQYFLPLIPWAVDNLDFSGFDVVISSSSAFAKNIRVPKTCVHICYCHTPPRFLWTEKNYVREEVPWALRPFVRLVLSKMRKWDLLGSGRVNYFIANSLEVQKRVERVYQRTSTVVHPGVDTTFWTPDPNVKKTYYLAAGRLQAHKNNELIIKIFNQLGLPLRVAGTGRQEAYLKSVAKPNIKFLGFISDKELRQEYRGALAFIYPQLEDFGLMPLEAAACGTATLALGQGGALETVEPGISGEFFSPADPSLIVKLIKVWDPIKYPTSALVSQAQKFSKQKFKENILKVVSEVVK